MPIYNKETGKVTESMKLIALKWKQLSDDQKARYEKKSKEDASRKAKEMVVFQTKYPTPKRELSNYTKYVQKMIPALKKEQPTARTSHLMKVVAQRWKQEAI